MQSSQVVTWEIGHRSNEWHGSILREPGACVDARFRRIPDVDLHTLNPDKTISFPNRRLFLQAIEAMGAAQSIQHARLAVLCVELDRFRHMRASFGQDLCDRVVAALQHRIREVCGKRLVALAQTSAGVISAALSLTDACRPMGYAQSVSQTLDQSLYVGPGLCMCLSGAVGMAVYPDHGSGLGQLLEHAEMAAQQAKTEAGEGYKIFEADSSTATAQRCSRDLLVELQQAIARQELSLAFQPKVELRSVRCIGAEALLRWHSPVAGEISPSRFIPLAEDSGLIGPIGDWALCEAVAAAAQHARPGYSGRLAINVSACQLANRHFVAQLSAALQRNAVDGASIEIEVTESAVLTNAAVAARRLKELKELGITIALDDFGTGYATLASLKQLPIDVLKIGPEFISDIAVEKSSARLVHGVIKMGHLMGLSVVAEGIETEAQSDLLKEYGCDIGQGYLFSKPLAQRDFLKWAGSQ